MLKITRGKLSFIVPFYWLDGWGFLKPEAIAVLAVFFGVMTNEEADKDMEKRLKRRDRGWFR